MKKNLSQKIAWVLWVYIKTQFVVIVIVTLVSWGMLSLLDVKHALLISVITGSASIVPIFGIIITAIISALVAIFDSTRFLPGPAIVEGLAVLMLYGAINIGVDYFLSPYLIGKSTKIHPLILVTVILLGSFAFGFIGALLAIPILLVAKTIVENFKNPTV